MTKIIGVRFRNAGKIYYFDPLDMDIETGMHVIVETARGVEFGSVVFSPREIEDEKVPQTLKPIIRIATDADEEQQYSRKVLLHTSLRPSPQQSFPLHLCSYQPYSSNWSRMPLLQISILRHASLEKTARLSIQMELYCDSC